MNVSEIVFLDKCKENLHSQKHFPKLRPSKLWTIVMIPQSSEPPLCFLFPVDSNSLFHPYILLLNWKLLSL